MTSLWNWIKSLFTPAPVSTTTTPLTPTAISAAIDFAPAVTAGFNAAAAGANLVGKVIDAEDTPAMVQARKDVAIQKVKDRINADAAAALKSGDVTKINQDLA